MFIYLYIYLKHTHPYVQIVNVIFTYSRSHCCECADGLFEFSSWTGNSASSRAALGHAEIPEGSRGIASCFISF